MQSGLSLVRYGLQSIRTLVGITNFSQSALIFGEKHYQPTIVPKLDFLLEQFKADGYFLAMETNGLKPVPKQIDYIAASPKRLYAYKYEARCIEVADEVRIVADEDMLPFCERIEQKIQAEHYYLSPCEIDGKMNLLETITQLGQLNQRPNKPKWQLSLQTHKLIGIA